MDREAAAYFALDPKRWSGWSPCRRCIRSCRSRRHKKKPWSGRQHRRRTLIPGSGKRLRHLAARGSLTARTRRAASRPFHRGGAAGSRTARFGSRCRRALLHLVQLAATPTSMATWRFRVPRRTTTLVADTQLDGELRLSPVSMPSATDCERRPAGQRAWPAQPISNRLAAKAIRELNVDRCTPWWSKPMVGAAATNCRPPRAGPASAPRAAALLHAMCAG